MRFRYSTSKDGKLVKKAVVYTPEEHGISFSDVDNDAVRIVERLKESGFDSYIVGGAVRDLILGKKPKDFDIVSEASPARIKKIFRNSRLIGNRFRLVHVYAGNKIFEVCTFRSLKEGHTGNSFGTIEEDVLRRDFTVNSLFYDPQRQLVVDFVGGMNDIGKKRIRPVIPLNTIFTDDPVRMIRAVKYGAATGFKLPLSLRWRIRRDSSLLARVSPSRLTEEIVKIIHSAQAARIIESLDALGLYSYLQPNASTLLRENPGFRERYLQDLAAAQNVDGEGPGTGEKKPGQAMSSLIRAFLEDTTDWNLGDSQENYYTAFMGARRFVLPMNPPRLELDHAVRLVFAEHGITVKRSRFPMRSRPSGGEGGRSRGEQAPARSSGAAGAPAARPVSGSPPAGREDPGEAPKKRRRRKRRKAAVPEGGLRPGDGGLQPGEAQGTGLEQKT
ncbi:MAG: polynucleotide adenylyltransferase PcnB [Treponema sp.]|jgi:poly(A) polymerase|nr:polynucleotide adenylyltransferase PcnB [Treponema sp.]